MALTETGFLDETAGTAGADLAFRGEGLEKVYETGETSVFALRGVDIAVPRGDMIVLLGPSGSGKSTLLNILGGLDRPTAGRLFYRDTELTALDDRALTRFRRQQIGFIFQFYNLIPSLTAEENVRLVTDIAHDPMDAREALDMVGLADRRHHFPAQLSGGEQQRVAVARAIAKRPGVLLCDEPTGALDSSTGVRVLETLERAHDELGTTVVIITHNVGIAAMAHRVLHFSDGRIARIDINEAPIRPGTITW
ncbi:ABC transporter ATP-binding protein [Novosphingobium sp. ZN18A2]|uniref:ABC transporter ATP-binding protein n=1 Tax=Novosphingobium sp. ZN18A2 TaxID=3079861 RepID=UPI0030CCB6AF